MKSKEVSVVLFHTYIYKLNNGPMAHAASRWETLGFVTNFHSCICYRILLALLALQVNTQSDLGNFSFNILKFNLDLSLAL